MKFQNIARLLSASALAFVVGGAFVETASAQQVQCVTQFGANNLASQIQNGLFGGGVIPLYQTQCLGQVGAGNAADQLQNAYGVPNIQSIPGNYPLTNIPAGGQGLLQVGNNNWALQQNVNLILPQNAGLNIAHSEANPTVINNNSNYNFVGR